jgi:allophanate hydrolase
MLQDQPFLIGSLHDAYAGGLGPAAVVTEAFRRIEAAGDPGIFLHLEAPEAALAAAAALGSFDPVAKPLWGVPFAIKDNIDSAGAPTTAACPNYAYTAERDAFVVSALRRAGAILIGKTNLDQFATGLVGVRTPYAVPLNALDPAIVPGGSSSGSAVAVARGLVSFALGTDTAGSGRVPAALNGIVGLKPTLGALSNSGVVPACRTLDTLSIFALTVDDAYRVYRQAALYDAADPYARPVTVPPPGAAAPTCHIGVPDAASRRFFGDALQAESFAAALTDLAALGGEIVEVDFAPFYDVAEMLYEGAWVAERFAVIEDMLRDQPEAVHPVTRKVIEKARAFSAADAFRGFYRLQELKRRTAPLLAAVDLLCVPTIPTFYSLADLDADPIGPNARFGTYTNFVNLLDLCALAAPTAPRRDGRPGSVTLLAPAGQDARIAALGRALQHRAAAPLGATGWRAPAPAQLAAAAQPDEIALAVVGAHMSGLPLNGELTALGARFLRTAETAPCYRLYSLPGGPPVRPGLLRDDSGGSAVALEVWALPSARFGEFIRNIPAPLGIGTLRLESGEEVKGFLCEAGATQRAEEVTAFGGWRAFLAAKAAAQQQPRMSVNPMNKESDHV